jgi:hypothetical protein
VRKRSWKFKLAAVGLSLLVTLLAAEQILRFYLPMPLLRRTYVGQRPNRPLGTNYVVDEKIGWRLRASHRFHHPGEKGPVLYASDATGFRCSAEDAQSKRRTIVVAGDSQVWGFGVAWDETFGARVAAGLGDCTARNLAQPGFGLDQIMLAVRHYGLPLKPDLVVVGLFEPDFGRSMTAYREREQLNKPAFRLDDDGELRLLTAADTPNAFRRYLEGRSRIYALFKLVSRRGGRNHGTGPWWRLNRALLDAMRADCAQAGVPLLFLRIPALVQPPFPTLDRYMKETGANYADPDAQPRPDARLYQRDEHLSAEGHRWLADTCLRWIDANLPPLR